MPRERECTVVVVTNRQVQSPVSMSELVLQISPVSELLDLGGTVYHAKRPSGVGRASTSRSRRGSLTARPTKWLSRRLERPLLWRNVLERYQRLSRYVRQIGECHLGHWNNLTLVSNFKGRESRRIGTYHVAGLNLKCYFKVRQ